MAKKKPRKPKQERAGRAVDSVDGARPGDEEGLGKAAGDDSEGEGSASQGHDDETAEALEELESQELQLLEDEVNEALLVDEVEELRAMRREELTMNVDAQSQKEDEFVCRSCFMVKRISQLAKKRNVICRDCVA